MQDFNKYPSFCYHLFTQGFVDKILLPPAFIKENKKMLAKTCLLKTSEDVISWEAKIVREKSSYFICEGEWSKFVMHHKLELGYILLFFLIDKSIFHIMVYTQKSGTRLYGLQNIEELSSSSDEDEEDNNIGPSRKSQNINMEPNEPSDVAEEEAASGDEENGQGFSAVNFQNEDPYCTLVIKKSHFNCMSIPMEFARRNGIIGMKSMTLIDEKGNEWPVSLIRSSASSSIRISKGWPAFVQHNNIGYGDTCLFKLI